MNNLNDYKGVRTRKWLHYAISLLVIILLFSVFLLIYNEVYNAKKLEKINQKIQQYEILLDRLRVSENENNMATELLLQYLLKKNANYLIQYDSVLKNFQSEMGLLKNYHLFENTVIDTSIIEKMTRFLNEERSKKENKINLSNAYSDIQKTVVKDVLLSTEIVTKSQVDTVQKKKLFKRLGDALSGNVDVQKEKTDMTVTMKYGDKIEEVSLSEYVKKTVERALNIYQGNIDHLNEEAQNLYKKNYKLINNNDSINKYTKIVVSNYKQTINTLHETAVNQYKKQNNTNKTIRLLAALSILILLLFLSFYSLYITQKTYHYEELILSAKDELQENLKFKNRIVSMISHEIRSPLSIISLLSKQILNKEKDKEKSEIFESVNYTTNNILLLSNQILEYSKNENKTLEIKLEAFNLYNEINKILDSFSTLAENKGNKIIRHIQIKNNLSIVSDKSKLHQLFYNILGNAIKYTEKGEIQVNTVLFKDQNESMSFKLEVKDTGIGIAKEDLDRVLNPFQQGSNKLIGYQNIGVGLGLYICKEIVDLLGGTIEVQSELHKGTMVKLSFPVQENENNK